MLDFIITIINVMWSHLLSWSLCYKIDKMQELVKAFLTNLVEICSS